MEVKCYKPGCGKTASASETNLVDKGWQGATGIFNTKHYTFAACPDHTDDFVKEFPKLLLAMR